MRYLFLLAFLLPAGAIAHQGATGQVKVRMELMKEDGAAAKTAGQMAKSGVIDENAAREAAEILEDAARQTPVVFKTRNLDAPTEALPLIWEEWDRFVALSDEMAQASAQLADATGDITQFRSALGAVGKTCSSCHEAFRRPE